MAVTATVTFFRVGDFRVKKESETAECDMSFFPYMGGKSRQAKSICRLLPEHGCYVEIFAGAANVLFTKPKSKTEVINDINGDLVNLFRIAKYHYRELVHELRFITCSRELFDDYRSQPGLTDIQRAARTYFVLKTAFGGRGGTKHPSFGTKTSGKAAMHRDTIGVIKRCHRRLSGVIIEALNFADCIHKYDRRHTVFFCDPPYIDLGGYIHSFDWADHEKLADMLRSIEGKFLLTINDHPRVRKLYKGFNQSVKDVRYTVSRDKSKSASERKELLIANYPLPGRN